MLLQAVFDNDLTLPYAFLISVWATVFLEFWKRRCNILASEWNVYDYERDEVTRPEWEPSTVRISPVTGKTEVYFSRQKQVGRMLFSCIVIGVAILVVLASLAGFIAFRAYIKTTSLGTIGSGILSAVISIVSIYILDFVYKKVAVLLNDNENYKQASAYQDALIGKNFLFDFINFYSTLFWIGVIHPWLTAYVLSFFTGGVY